MKGLRLLRCGMLYGMFLALLDSCGGTVRLAEGAKAAPEMDMSKATSTTGTCWIYTHLNKSGGSTVKTIMMHSWGPRFYTYVSIQWRKGNDYLHSVAGDLAGGQRWNVVGGGYAEALRHSSSVVDSKCQWFTVFRHPIPRLVSAFYYCKGTPKDQACASEILSAKDVDLVTFAKHWGNYATRQFALGLVPVDDVLEFSQTDAAREMLPATVTIPSEVPGWYLVKLYLNDQTRRASNSEHTLDAALWAMLQPVQDLLRDHYSAVGILEEFDTTFSLFNAALDIPAVDWRDIFESVGEHNVDRMHKDDKEATLAEAWTNSEIKKYMQLDLILYEHAVDIFRQLARAYGISSHS